MQKIVECVPNFSEGVDMSVIDQITREIEQTDGAVLLDVDPGANTNRTVVTIVGEPEPVMEAAFRAIKKASEVIDMRQHTGAHPRMGATDVCPFVPVSGVTMDDCAEYARKLGKRVGDELGISVFLYENAASTPERKNLANIRAGEYEGMAEKLKDPKWKPDFGPVELNKRAGVTAIGAREFLIAYNINLNTRDKSLAHDIALTIREKGRWARDESGKLVKDADGKKVRQEGMFQNCKAIGWFIDEYNRAQISINLTNARITPPHLVFEAVRDLALKMGMRVTGSELVGLTPKAAMIEAGKYYLAKQGRCTGVPDRDIIEIAVMSLGLDELSPWDTDKKVIEYCIEEKNKLADMTVKAFIDEISVESPVPGGGSVAALCGALSSALSAMVANLTHGKKSYENVWDDAELVADKGQELKDFFIRAIDLDSESFDKVLEAMRLPKKTDEDKAARDEAIQTAQKGAVNVPMETLEKTIDALEIAEEIASIGNVNSVSDAGVAAQCARAAAIGAAYNVLINLDGIEDEAFVSESKSKAEELRKSAEDKAAAIDAMILEKLQG
jgi:glutamate formiminotransferase/formiminotetrahydrofolate cyclodeaminase